MADNKFIAKLRGEPTPKSVVEIHDDKIIKPLTGAPNSSVFDSGILDDTQSSTVVANAAQNWTLNGNELVLSNDTTYISERAVSGAGLWANASYTFPPAISSVTPVMAIINPFSKWIFRLVGKNLASENEYIPFTMILTAGSKDVATATFSAKRSANFFCQKFILDFAKTADEQIRVNEGEKLTLQLICEDATASATIYNGSSVLSLLQRRVDADMVATENVTFGDLVDRTNTLRNDLDDLGDQVSNIQALIPENATTENLLTTADDLKAEAEAREEADTALNGRLTELDNHAVKKSATEMQAISGPLSVTDEICLIDADDGTAKHSLAIVAGIPTETAEEMDIVGARKFDELPTADDVTTYDDLNPKKLITKGQVASAVSVKATKSTDFMTPITAENKGATKTEIDLLTASIAEKADKTALNLKQDIATALNYGNITNCITEIPQDIKLELNNGTLTLKAGSKVYVPNGVGVFDEVVIASDLTISLSGTNQYFIFVLQNGSGVYTGTIGDCFSGATQPTVSAQYAYWYDTTNNVIKFTSNTGSTWTNLTCSLPVAIATVSSGVISSIDQVFNGFGYIGSTVFVLPGVKGLIPDGRNPDGSLNNIVISTDSVKTYTYTSDFTINDVEIGITTNYVIDTNYFTYNEKDNTLFNNSGLVKELLIAKANFNNGKITSFTPKTVFHAVDYSDTGFMAHQAMPSDRYIDLTLGATASLYTAPADGFIAFNKTATAVGQDIYLGSANIANVGIRAHAATPNVYLSIIYPIKKGDIAYVAYTANGTTNRFSFIYAEGSK